MRLLFHQLRNEQRLYWRSHELAFFTFLFPVLIFVLLGSVYGNDKIKSEGGIKGSHYLLAGMLGYGVASTAFIAGSFWSPHAYPRFLEVIADVLPLTYFIRMTRDIVLHGAQIWNEGTAVAVLVAWGALGLFFALRRFRWEPRDA